MLNPDLTARTVFALADADSCFGGSFELALASDRIYMLDSPDDEVFMNVGPLSNGAFPMSNGLTRLQTRFLGNRKLSMPFWEPMGPSTRRRHWTLGWSRLPLMTWIGTMKFVWWWRSERATACDAYRDGGVLRFAGPETMETKIFGRLSAWQNWIFQRPNAVGDREHSLSMADRAAVFDWRRT